MRMRTISVGNVLSVLALAATLGSGYPVLIAQSGATAVPFKVGTFERNAQPFVGLVLRDSHVVDIVQANAAFERRNASTMKISMPGDMKELIGRYETELKPRLYALASDVAAASSAPSYSYPMGTLKVLPPVRPALLLNAGGNYVEHEQGIAQQQQRAGGAAPARRLARSLRRASGSGNRATNATIRTCL